MWIELSVVAQIPDPPAPDDTNGVLLWFATLAVLGLVWLGRSYIKRLERSVDEMVPLLRELSALLKQMTEDARRRDELAAKALADAIAHRERIERAILENRAMLDRLASAIRSAIKRLGTSKDRSP